VLVTQPSVDHGVDCADQHNQSDDENSILAKFAAAEHSGDLCKSSSSAQIDPERRFRRRDVKRSRYTHSHQHDGYCFLHSLGARAISGVCLSQIGSQQRGFFKSSTAFMYFSALCTDLSSFIGDSITRGHPICARIKVPAP
jgi:hypothetical protein